MPQTLAKPVPTIDIALSDGRVAHNHSSELAAYELQITISGRRSPTQVRAFVREGAKGATVEHLVEWAPSGFIRILNDAQHPFTPAGSISDLEHDYQLVCNAITAFVNALEHAGSKA